MKLLFVTPECPDPPRRGYSIILHNHIRHLSRRHAIDLITFSRGPDDPGVGALEACCHRVERVPLSRPRALVNAGLALLRGEPLQVGYYRSPAMAAAVARALRDGAFDAVIFQLTRTAQFRPVWHAEPAILSMVDPFVLNYERSLAWRPWYARLLFAAEGRRLKRYESRVAPSFDRVLLLSEPDARDYRDYVNGAPLDWVPHAVDAGRFVPSAGVARDPKMIIVTGSMFHAPNIDAVDYFCREILDLVLREEPNAKLWVVGSRPGARIRRWAAHPRVEVTGAVPDVRPYLNRAAVSICPVRLSVGTQTKVLESLAMGTPVVTTSAGNQGVGGRPGEHLHVADTPADFAAHVVSLLRGERWTELSERGRAFVTREFSWEASAARLERILRDVISERRESPGGRARERGARASAPSEPPFDSRRSVRASANGADLRGPRE